MNLKTVFAVTVLLLLAVPAVGSTDILAIEAGHVLTMAGEDLSPGLVLVRRGRIEAIGAPDEIDVPDRAERLEFPEGVLMPAFVEAHSQRGMRRANETHYIDRARMLMTLANLPELWR